MPSVASRRLEARPPPPAYRRGGRKPGPSLTQFVVLSLLLHALFILLFGSPTGGSPQGRAMWGSLAVTVRGPLLDSGTGTSAARESRLRLPGSELLQRRQEAREVVAPPVAVTPPATTTPPAPAIAPVPERPLPEPGAAQVVDVAPLPPAMLETPVLPAATDLVPAPRVVPVPREVPVVSVPTLEFAPRPAIETNLAPPAEVLPVPKPRAVPVVPAPLLSTTTLPAVTPSLDSAVSIATPAPREPVAVPVPAPMIPATAVPVATPNLDPAASVAAPAPRAAPATPPATAKPAAPAAERAGAREPTSTGGPSPRDSPIFDNRRPPAAEAPPPGGAPRIDLDAARARAREVAREGTGNRALLPFPMPPAQERKTKEQVAIEKAWKPDCKDAYKGLGLLAVVPLLANEIGEGNCRW